MTFGTYRPDRVARGRSPRAGAFAGAAVVLALCGAPVHAADDDDAPNNAYVEKFSETIGGGVKSMQKMIGLGKPPGPPPTASPSGCPIITVLDGTGAQRVTASATAGNAGLRHQFSITEVARECTVSNNRMTVKVGVEGKVLLGPAGSSGTFDVPIRVAIINQVDDKPLLSKLYKVAATIPQGRTTTPYALVADQIVIPFEAGRTAQDYSIKVGIDSAASGEGPAKARKRKGKPVAAAN